MELSNSWITDPENVAFIKDNLNARPDHLALKYGGDSLKRRLITQIAVRQQIKKKIPDWFSNLKLIMPERLNAEQASSQATAQLKSELINGETFVDGNGGFGVDTYFLSQNFNNRFYFEINDELAQIANHNFNVLDADITVQNGDFLKNFSNFKGGTLYLDPARRDENNNAVFSLEDYTPNLVPVWENLKEVFDEILIKTSPMLSIPMALKQLTDISEIWVISYRNECKEVVYRHHKSLSKKQIKTFNITSKGLETFNQITDFKVEAQPLNYSAPDRFIYEPNSSILKAGLQDYLAAELELKKLHPHSHFYTSNAFLADFPGRKLEVQQMLKPFDKSLNKQRFNVISRNFPDKASSIEKRLKLKPAKNEFLLATTLYNGDKSFIIANQL